MSKEKQIEEMAKALTKYEKGLCERLPKDKCLLTSAIHAQVSCDYCKIAEFLYNAGYRKQSEGEWRSELVKRCDWKGKEHDYYQPNSCSLCHEAVLKRTPFCPYCGAKMKGGAE